MSPKADVEVSSLGDTEIVRFSGDVDLTISSPGTREARVESITFEDRAAYEAVKVLVAKKFAIASGKSLKVALKMNHDSNGKIMENGEQMGGSGSYTIGVLLEMLKWAGE